MNLAVYWSARRRKLWRLGPRSGMLRKVGLNFEEI